LKNPLEPMIHPADYDRAAVVWREAGDQMLGRLSAVAWHPRHIVEVGCRTGYCTELLLNRYPDAQLIAMDESAVMIDYAKTQCKGPVNWIITSLDQLPLSAHSVDLLVSNLYWPQSTDIEKTFSEWRRVLRPGGLLMMSGWGMDTLREYPPDALCPFLKMDMHDVGDLLLRAGFSDPVLDAEYFELRYKNLQALKLECRAMGLMNDASFLVESNEQHSYPLTFEIFYAHAWGGLEKQTITEDGLTTIPLAHLRRQLRGDRL
jgi:malonyl-CoA O-methyltransferase